MPRGEAAARRESWRGFWKSVGLGLVAGVFLKEALIRFEAGRAGARVMTRRRRRRRLEARNSSCVGSAGWGWIGEVDRSKALGEVNGDVPAAIQTGPKGALVLSSRVSETRDAGEEVPSSCGGVAVVVAQASPGRCQVLASSRRAATYRVARREARDGSWSPFSRVREAKQRMPSESTRKRARALATRLLSRLDDVLAKLEPILREVADGKRVLVMAINSGNLDLLLNFVLSAKCMRIDVRNLLVFAADPAVERALAAASIAAFRHDALGEFRAEPARSYGDHQFVEMMWLKITSVFLVNAAGYDALFQDADLVWWKSPWPFFDARPDLDTFWMDDGARTSRFAPHFPNTGFYLVRANPRTRLFMTQLLGAYAAVLAWQSHQAVVSQLLAEAHALYGLSLHVLDKTHFPSGKQLHHNRPLFDQIHARTFTPFCFHMCWTAGKADKLKFLKQERLWFLPPTCALQRLLDSPRLVADCLARCPADAARHWGPVAGADLPPGAPDS